MRLRAICLLIWIIGYLIDNGKSLPLNSVFMRSLALKRLKRGSPTGNVFDPPLPVFPAKENAPFWNPAPYPLPTTVAPPPSIRKKLPYYDPNNPYLDGMVDGYYPNYGLGFAYQTPTQVGGGLNWPTGNALMPSDHFNGTIGVSRPIQLRVGMQGGPVYPWQNPQYIKTAKDINDANTLSQVAQMQGDAARMPLTGGQGGTPTGFIPVQQQMFIPVQQTQPQQFSQQQFFPQQQMQMVPVPQSQPYFANFPNRFSS